jgi:hypothetical protein
MLRSVPSKVILRPGLGRLSQPVQMKHHLVHHYGILRDFVCSRLIIELNQSMRPPGTPSGLRTPRVTIARSYAGSPICAHSQSTTLEPGICRKLRTDNFCGIPLYPGTVFSLPTENPSENRDAALDWTQSASATTTNSFPISVASYDSN